MTSTEQTTEPTTVAATEAPKVTAKRLTIPDVPAILRESKKGLHRNAVRMLDGLIEDARNYADIIYRYAVGQSQLEDELKTSDDDAVVAYRQALAKAVEERAASDAQKEADIAPFIAAWEERNKKIAEAPNAAKATAREALGHAIGVTAEERAEAVSDLKDVADLSKTTVAQLKRQGMDLGDWAIPVHRGGKGGSSSNGGFRPWLDSATVNGTAVPANAKGKVGMADVGKAVGRKSDQLGTCLLAQPLSGDRSVWDEAAPGTAFSFTIDDSTGKPANVTVVKAFPPVKTNDDGTQEVQTDDDSDDDDDDSADSE